MYVCVLEGGGRNVWGEIEDPQKIALSCELVITVLGGIAKAYSKKRLDRHSKK